MKVKVKRDGKVSPRKHEPVAVLGVNGFLYLRGGQFMQQSTYCLRTGLQSLAPAVSYDTLDDAIRAGGVPVYPGDKVTLKFEEDW